VTDPTAHVQPTRRTIVIEIELDVTAWDDRSGLSPDELARRVYDAVEEERNELAGAARAEAIRLMDGGKP
jgi:hypothetical protein